jgi:hypothetical protein
MKKLTVLGVIAVCTLFAGPAAKAQMGRGPSMPTPQGIFNPVVGGGATYEMTTKNGTKMTMDIAIVGKESYQGKDGFWYEVSTDVAQAGGTVVMKMLLVPEANNASVPKMVMQMPGRGPMEMDGMMGRGMSQNQTPKDIRDSAKDIGSESVTVPAGTFTADHWKSNDGKTDVWVAKDVPPYGLVKMTDTDGTLLVLDKVLTNVQDKITGTPMDMSQMMRGAASH